MKTSLAELGIGVVTALLSSILVGGALLMSLTEGRPAPAPPPANTATSSAGTPVSTLATPRPSPTLTPTLTCPVPLGWHSYSLQPGDTWEGLAAQTGATVDQLRQGNCDFAGSLLAGSLLNLPPTPTATPSPTATNTSAPTEEESPTDTPQPTADLPAGPDCTPPSGWIVYVVRSGDTLYLVGLRYNLVYTELMRANCLKSEKIISGQRLYVPNIPPLVSATSTTRPTDPPPPTSPPDTVTPQPPATEIPAPTTEVPTSTPETPPPTDPAPPTETPTTAPAATESPTLATTP